MVKMGKGIGLSAHVHVSTKPAPEYLPQGRGPGWSPEVLVRALSRDQPTKDRNKL